MSFSLPNSCAMVLIMAPRKPKTFPPVAEQLELIERGATEILVPEELVKKLEKSRRQKRPLVVKCGFDPSAPDLHLGHTVLLQKMRQFQKLGHKVVFLIGDFTGMIGDPSGKSELRKLLSRAEVQRNAKTYQAQVFKILDSKLTRIDFNSRWMEKMSASDLIELSTHYTVARMLERDDFQKRYREQNPISIREFLYPIVQGYDSVALKADVELGGSDQKFNLLVGREMQRASGQEPQVILTMPLLVGLDGVQKMSKSLGNYVGIAESPKEMFGKLMSISDDLMIRYFELLTDISNEELRQLQRDLKSGKSHPREVKARLAEEIVARYHGATSATKARSGFDLQFRDRGIPDERLAIPRSKLNPGQPWIDFLHETLPQLRLSKGELRRLIQQKAVKVFLDGKLEEGALVTDPLAPNNVTASGGLIKIGKRNWAEVTE